MLTDAQLPAALGIMFAQAGFAQYSDSEGGRTAFVHSIMKYSEPRVKIIDSVFYNLSAVACWLVRKAHREVRG